MKADNPFDRKLDTWGKRVPISIRDSAIMVTDTLDIAWAAAQAIFEDQAKPEHALKILELFLSESSKKESVLSKEDFED
jgi:hypothetical protein